MSTMVVADSTPLNWPQRLFSTLTPSADKRFIRSRNWHDKTVCQSIADCLCSLQSKLFGLLEHSRRTALNA